MATDFSNLGLDSDAVRLALQDAGIDDSFYTDEQLSNLMLVSNIVLSDGIRIQAIEVEEFILDFQQASERLAAYSALFQTLVDELEPADATAQSLATVLTQQFNVFSTGNASSLTLDYTLSSDVTGFSGSQTYDTIADLMSAVESNATTSVTNGTTSDLISVEYYKALDEGLVGGFYDVLGNASTMQNFLDGNAYVEVIDSSSSSPLQIASLDSFKQYVLAKALQNAGYLGDDVSVTPLATSDPNITLDIAGNDYLEYDQAWQGAIEIQYDTSVDTLLVTMNSVAVIADMGVDLSKVVAGLDDVAYDMAFGTGDLPGELLSTYVNGDDWTDLMDDLGQVLQSEASNSEIAMLQVSTSLTEWSEMHAAWDSVHRYITDAMSRSMAFLK
ncbi:hypothetical protein [Roseiconus lacunae]|uniref:hypothetical protein n=1 Tax=Roseiconus lacunae TaxID=2605694 RepID=UPI001E5E66C7|nr:hypothetical protein [Roseiconus lacunae]MCD0457888.1 hypothetical protein [Roseiconus lacunae]